jgi:hypothetical protein
MFCVLLAGCRAEPEARDDGDEPGPLAGSEAGNPPIADHEVCADESGCKLSARRFVAALAEPLELEPLQGSCVQDVSSSYCECKPAGYAASARDPLVFAWPALVSANDAADLERGCLLWTRLAAVLPALRSDPQSCLFSPPEPSACEADACGELCRQVHEAREADAALRYDAQLRFARCGHSENACAIVFELEGRCYAKHGALGVESQGPFDCSLSDTQILDRAYPGWDRPASEDDAS